MKARGLVSTNPVAAPPEAAVAAMRRALCLLAGKVPGVKQAKDAAKPMPAILRSALQGPRGCMVQADCTAL